MSDGMFKNLYDSYQENIGQPFARSRPGQYVGGMLGFGRTGTDDVAYAAGGKHAAAADAVAAAALPTVPLAAGTYLTARSLIKGGPRMYGTLRSFFPEEALESVVKKTNKQVYQSEKSALKNAKIASEEGIMDMDEVAEQFGWFKRNGKWMKFVPDTEMTLDPTKLKPTGKMGDWVEHPGMRAWNPSFFDAPYTWKERDAADAGRYGAGFSPFPKPRFEFDMARNLDASKMQSAVAHEGQHGIQYQYGMDPGGNPKVLEGVAKYMDDQAKTAEWQQRLALVTGRMLETGKGKMPAKGTPEYDAALSKIVDDAKEVGGADGTWFRNKQSVDNFVEDWGYDIQQYAPNFNDAKSDVVSRVRELQQRANSYRSALSDYMRQIPEGSFLKGYKNLGGEREAYLTGDLAVIPNPSGEMITRDTTGWNLEKYLQQLESKYNLMGGELSALANPSAREKKLKYKPKTNKEK